MPAYKPPWPNMTDVVLTGLGMALLLAPYPYLAYTIAFFILLFAITSLTHLFQPENMVWDVSWLHMIVKDVVFLVLLFASGIMPLVLLWLLYLCLEYSVRYLTEPPRSDP